MNSVCMATYNGEKYLKEQIASILSQLSNDDELIISDDSSGDRTVEIIKKIPDKRVRFLGSFAFRNPIKNFQHALKAAKGKYVFLSDQDDVWLEGKYMQMLALLQQYDLVISDSVVVTEHLDMMHPSFFTYFGSGKGIMKNVIRSSYYGNCMAFHTRILTAALPFPDTKEIGHDLWLGLVAEIIGSVYFYDKPLLLYRRHANAFTNASMKKSTRSISQMLQGRLVMVRELIKFYTRFYFNGSRARFNNYTSL